MYRRDSHAGGNRARNLRRIYPKSSGRGRRNALDAPAIGVVYYEIEIRFSLSFLKGEGMPNYYAIKAKEVFLEILSTSTKPYYIPFYYNTRDLYIGDIISLVLK